MPRYKVTTTFDRTNPETNDPELDQTREGVFESENPDTASAEHIERVKVDEPTLTTLKETTVEEVPEEESNN